MKLIKIMFVTAMAMLFSLGVKAGNINVNYDFVVDDGQCFWGFFILSETNNTVSISWEHVSSDGGFPYHYNVDIINIPETVNHNGKTYRITEIADYAFWGCEGRDRNGNGLPLTVNIPESIIKIGTHAFAMSQINTITIPSSIKHIADYTFSNCRFNKITLSEGVESIGRYGISAKYYAGPDEDLAVQLPSSIKTIGIGGLKCKMIYITDITAWCKIDFASSSFDEFSNRDSTKLYVNGTLLTHLEVPEGVQDIKARTFSNYNLLTSVSFPNTVKSIGDRAFYGCKGLTEVTFSNGLESIGIAAFGNCGKLTSISLPNTLRSIGSYAFKGCNGFISFLIPANLDSIGDGILGSCVNLEDIFCSSANQNYASRDGVLYDKSYSQMLMMPSGRKGYFEILPSVTYIGNYAFNGCSSLTSVVIPNSVTSIGNSAFEDCSSLTSVIIPNSVTSIGNSAFYGCSSLTQVYISDIAAWCGISFGYNYGNPLSYAKHLYLDNIEVTNLIIPNSVTSIGYCAFIGCTGLTTVSIPNSVTSIGHFAFSGCSGLTTVAIPNSVTSIGVGVFRNCIGLQSVLLSEKLSILEQSLFSGCSSLLKIAIPDSVDEIGNNIFSGCQSLKSITLGKKLKKISSTAFVGCGALETIYNRRPRPAAIEESTFADVNKQTCYLYVPRGYGQSYWLTVYWKDFENIEEYDVLDYKFGDINGDGSVDIADVNAIINIMLGKAHASDFPGNADVTGDDSVDVADVNMIINIMLGKQ